MQAYDVLLEDWRAGVPAPDGQGWCFGLPPGLRPEQWPLDPHTGVPMMHGFTLLLPEDYRVHGPDLVAVSFFATAPDGFDGSPMDGPEGMAEAVTSEAPPSDPALRPYWERAQRSHPRLTRMEDILGCAFGTILLTAEEFAGPPCRPPAPVDSPLAAGAPALDWLSRGSAAAYEAFNARLAPPVAADDPFLIHRPIRWQPRASDPNAGKPPRESWDGTPPDSGYESYFYWLDGKVEVENWREHDWAAGHAPMHIGGTMRPVQAIPEFSPYYIEFEEDFGGYNFGGGNAQLDFKEMKFDWACG